MDSPETLLAEWEAMTGGDPDDPWVQRYAEDNVPEVATVRAIGGRSRCSIARGTPDCHASSSICYAARISWRRCGTIP